MDFLLSESPVPWVPVYLHEDPAADPLFALVSPEDWAWVCRHVWRPKWDKHGRKCYAVRTVEVGSQRRGRERRQASVFLHKEVCLRHLGPPTHPAPQDWRPPGRQLPGLPADQPALGHLQPEPDEPERLVRAPAQVSA